MMRTLETVDRALQMLMAFDGPGEDELSVGALAARLQIHRSSASRLAATLAQRGFLERAPGGDAFRLGPTLSRLGLLAISDRDLLTESRPILDRLARETGETIVLSTLEGDAAIALAQASGSHLVGMRSFVGSRAPLHASSDGKVLLAFGATGIPQGRLMALTPRTITDRDVLEQEIERVRGRGWATTEGEFEEGMNGIARPVFDDGGVCVAAISVCGPAYRMTSQRILEIETILAAATERLRQRLAHPVIRG